MACNVVLFDFLGGTPDTGGEWTLVSASDVTLIVDGNPSASFSNGDTIGSDHNPTIGFDDTAVGSFDFNYSVGTAPCGDNQTITVNVVNGAKAGVDVNVTYCDTDSAAKVLYNLLTGADNNGEWSSTSGNVTVPTYNGYSANTANDPTDDTFTPSTAGIGVYNFYYIIDNSVGDTPANCDNCIDESALTITVTDAADAGQSSTITVCNNL